MGAETETGTKRGDDGPPDPWDMPTVELELVDPAVLEAALAETAPTEPVTPEPGRVRHGLDILGLALAGSLGAFGANRDRHTP